MDEDDPLPWPPNYYPWGHLAPLALGRVVNDYGLMRDRTLRSLGVLPCELELATQWGRIRRVRRGLWSVPTVGGWRESPIAQVSTLRPSAVLALRDAAMLWGLIPFDDWPAPWFAIGNKDRKPKTIDFPVNWLRWSKERLVIGVEEHRYDRVPVRLTTPARTIADYFAHPRRVPGEAMAMLHAFRASPYWDLGALKQMSELCRVTRRVQTALKELNCSFSSVPASSSTSQVVQTAAIFAREVARTGRVWTLRGASLPEVSEGVVPIWSSCEGATQAVADAFANFQPFELSWDEFKALWIPTFEAEGFQLSLDGATQSVPPIKVRSDVDRELEKLSS